MCRVCVKEDFAIINEAVLMVLPCEHRICEKCYEQNVDGGECPCCQEEIEYVKRTALHSSV